MTGAVTFDIYLLGLADPTPDHRARLVDAVCQLTGRAEADLKAALLEPERPLFAGLSSERLHQVVEALDLAGARIEIRPVHGGPGAVETAGPVSECPRCNFSVTPEMEECPRCGLVFAKWEREQIQKMQRERRLEEALSQAVQARREWDQRAKVYLERHPFPEQDERGFEKHLNREEIPFQRLESEQGPLLMTSRRLLVLREGTVVSIPYELIADVDMGGGLVVKKNQVRMQLTFHGPIKVGDKEVKSLAFNLDKESSFHKDLVMDWAFARKFICGACGARDLDFRIQGGKPHARCMHCATDHEIDTEEAVAIPILHD